MNNNAENELKELIDSIVKKSKDEDFTALKNSIKKLEAEGFILDAPEQFNLDVAYKTNRYIRTVIEYFCKEKELYDKEKYIFVYSNYDFLNSNIECLIAMKEGNPYSQDKTRFIINVFLNYTITGEILNFKCEEDEDKKYQIPKFGTMEEWVGFCGGVYELYHGQTKRYYDYCKALLESNARTYPHLLHSWYIIFKDGDEIIFAYTWDRDIENPLNNEYFDLGDYYVISKTLIGDRGYEAYNESNDVEGFLCGLVKVPKSDIANILRISSCQHI